MVKDELLWKQLRDEANSVKECFTRFSFQALAFSAVMLGAVANYQPTQPLVGLVGMLVIVVLLTVSRIGGYKYGTANRHFAFELYCDTYRNDRSAKIGWEEALTAWRVVAPAMFDALHLTPRDGESDTGERRGRGRWKGGWGRWKIRRGLGIETYRPDILNLIEHPCSQIDDATQAKMYWFSPPAQVRPLEWHPGRYLEQMQGVLHFIAYFSLLPLAMMTLQVTPRFRDALGLKPLFAGEQPVLEYAVPSLAWVVLVMTSGKLVIAVRQLNARRAILENGMLSIPASALVWRVAIEAHTRACETVKKENAPERYLHELGRITAKIATPLDKKPGLIWDWLEATAVYPEVPAGAEETQRG